MDRRDFLKLSGLVSLQLMGMLLPHVDKLDQTQAQVKAAGNVIYRGTSDGKIYVSDNKGSTWRIHTNFGPQYSIRNLYTQQDGKIFAHLAFQSGEFDLTLADNNKAWLTVV